MVVEPFAIPPASEERTDHPQPVAIATIYGQDPKGEEDEVDADVNEGVAPQKDLDRDEPRSGPSDIETTTPTCPYSFRDSLNDTNGYTTISDQHLLAELHNAVGRKLKVFRRLDGDAGHGDEQLVPANAADPYSDLRQAFASRHRTTST